MAPVVDLLAAVLRNVTTEAPATEGPPGAADTVTGTDVYATIVFFVTWLLIAPSKWAWFPLGRPASAMVGAALMMVGGAISFEDGLHAIGANLEVMALLFGLMVIASYLSSEGLYTYLELLFTFRCRSAFDLLARVVALCGVLSAFITNDAVCIFITPLIVKVCQKYGLPGGPFLIALGTSANIGSAATITGNPQNALIAIKGHISYVDFAKYMMPISFIGLAINYGFLVLMYWRSLARAAVKNGALAVAPAAAPAYAKDGLPHNGVGYAALGDDADAAEDDDAAELELVAAADGDGGGRSVPLAVFRPAVADSGSAGEAEELDGAVPAPGAERSSSALPLEAADAALASASASASTGRTCLDRRRVGQAAVVLTYLSALGVFIAFFVGVPIGLASFAGCVVTIAVQGLLRRREPTAALAEVDYNLMLFFAGLFIAVEAFNLTGFPEAMERAMFAGLDMRSAAGAAVFVAAVVVASNTLSNVPAVLLIAPFIATLAPDVQFAYWVIAAWVTTVGGNFTIIGCVDAPTIARGVPASR